MPLVGGMRLALHHHPVPLVQRRPHHVAFEIRGKEDPFVGEGTFNSVSDGTGTRIALEFGAQPTGSMARLLVPLVPPILNRTADEFTANLQAALDGAAPSGSAKPAPRKQGFWQRLVAKFSRHGTATS